MGSVIGRPDGQVWNVFVKPVEDRFDPKKKKKEGAEAPALEGDRPKAAGKVGGGKKEKKTS